MYNNPVEQIEDYQASSGPVVEQDPAFYAAFLRFVATVKGFFTELNRRTVDVNANYLMGISDGLVRVNAAGGNKTVTLPAAAVATGGPYIVKKMDATANTVTVAGTIDGAVNYVMNAHNQAVMLWCNGTDFDIVGKA